MEYIAFDATRYKSGSKYVIREVKSFKRVGIICANTRNNAVIKYKNLK